jgi:hypothetical protein
MKSATWNTALMFLSAIGFVLLALIYYPWPEMIIVDAEVGKPLFPQYNANQVWGIDVTRYDREKRTAERIRLVRRGEEWVVPARQEFVANQTRLIGEVVNALNDRTVYEVKSENQQDHIRYGVLDPGEFTEVKNVAALGTKLALIDRNNKVIADLIVGLAEKNGDGKHYVRVPGKPRIYTIEINPNILTTNFTHWISPDLLRLQPTGASQPRRVETIQLKNYRLGDDGNGKKIRRSIYTATLAPLAERVEIRSLSVPAGDPPENWRTLQTTPQIESALMGILQPLALFAIDDVSRKSEPLRDAIAAAKEVSDSLQAGFEQLGFANARVESGAWEFDSANGQIAVATNDGVVTNIWIGGAAGSSPTNPNKLNHFVLVRAAVNEGALKKPVRPPNLPDDDSEPNKAFLRKVESWSNEVRLAKRQADELNAVYDEWFYLLNADIVEQLRPDLPLPNLNDTPPDAQYNKPEKPSTDSS